jgi:transposase
VRVTSLQELVEIREGISLRTYLDKARSEGKSYRDLAAELGVAKSTIADWCHDLAVTFNQ